MGDDRSASLRAALAVAVCAVAAVLEGATLPAYGGLCIAAMGLLAVGTARVDRLGPATRLALVLLAVTLLWQVVPLPPLFRLLVAPGQSRLVDMAAPESTGDLHGWLDALARYDVLAAVGAAGPWDHDTLAGSAARVARPGTIDPSAWPWAVAQLGGGALALVVGVTVGRSERGARTFAVALLLVCVGQALFGIAHRDDTTTGMGIKTAYLGSATGTFINRGHYAAFLALGLGAAWGMVAALFPLLPEEVRRHMARKRRSSQPPSVMEVSGDKVPRLVLLLFGAAVLGIALVASQSRGPVVSFALSAAVVGTYTWRRRDEALHLGIGVGLVGASGVLAAVGFGVRGAFGRFFSLLSVGDVSLTSRWQVWKEGLRAFVDAPVFGAGAGAWRIAWGSREQGVHLYDFMHAHNEVVEQLVELGLVGTIGLVLLAYRWIAGVSYGVDTAEAGPRTALGIGAAVGVGAVLLQSLGDFPLHTPAVLLATGLSAGVAYGALTERPQILAHAPGFRVAGALLVGLAGTAALLDRSHPGSRAERLGEVPRVYFDVWEGARTDAPPELVEEAAVAVRRTPLDPWTQLAAGVVHSRLARDAADGARSVETPEDHAFAAERAVDRALRLRPRSPRVEVAAARVLLTLASTGYADARRERAVTLLIAAVVEDPWRAREAFDLAASLPREQLDRVGMALPEAPAARARVHYEQARALDARGDKAAARAAFGAALTDDPGHGPSLFALGVIARGEGNDAAMREMLQRFLSAKERPGGMEGWALLYLGEVDAAEVRFRRSVGENPENLWAWEGLAEVALREGDTEAERQVWRKVVQLRPTHPRARLRLQALGE